MFLINLHLDLASCVVEAEGGHCLIKRRVGSREAEARDPPLSSFIRGRFPVHGERKKKRGEGKEST